MTIRDATITEVRDYFRGRGDTVRVTREGRVTFKRYGDGPWLEGRWVSEYKFDAEDGTTYLP